MSCIFTLSDIPFTVTPGNYKDYIFKTGERMKKFTSIFSNKIDAWAIAKENVNKHLDIQESSTVEEIIASILDQLKAKGLAE
jgi:CRISPR/Cas system-associated protein Cas7 (RAMP superfamily)